MLTVLVVVILLVVVTIGERVIYGGEVLPGVEAAGLDLTGKREQPTRDQFEVLAHRLETMPVRARAGDTELSFEPAEIAYDLDVVATADAALAAGRGGNPLAQVGGTVLRRIRDDEVALSVTWDATALTGVLDRWDDELGADLQNGGLQFQGAEVVEVEPRPGVGLDRDEAERRLAAALRAGEDEVVRLPVGDQEPDVDAAEVTRAAAEARAILSAPFTVTVDGTPIAVTPEIVGGAMTATADGDQLVLDIEPDLLRTALAPALAPFETPPVDAGWQPFGNAVAVVPGVNGRTVDLEPVADAMLEQERTIAATVVETPPARTTEAVQALNITEKVSEFTTNYTAGQARVQNIHIAADRVNGTLLLPGETFSLNDTLGPRDCELGWVEAPGFATEEGFFQTCGGGVSQFSTTLFNATFFGGYEDVAHTPHTIYISRYPMGREATLNYGTIDNQFRNNSSSGVLITATYTDTSVTVTYYGNFEGRVVTAEGPNVILEIPIETELVPNPLLPAGEQVPFPSESGYTGYQVENFRVIQRPGQDPVRERFYWEYDMRPRKVFVGTAAA